MDPPVALVPWPALKDRRAPVPRLPLPTTTLMLPAEPSVADPVRNVIMPLLPLKTESPVVTERELDIPSEPAFEVLILKEPLDVALP